MDLPNTAASVYRRRAFRTRALGLALSSALVLGMAQPGRASEPLPPLPVVAAPAYPGGIYPLKLQVESLSILQTDAAYTLTVPPMIHQGRVMVEADLLGKLFHFQHRWNPETRELVLSGPGGQTARMLLTEQSFQVAELQARVAAAISAWRAAEQATADDENRQIAAEEARRKAALLVPSYANLERDSASHLGQVASFTGVMMKDGVNAEGVHGAFLATAEGFVMVLSDSDLGLVGKRVRITGRVRQPYVYPMGIGDLVIPTIVYQAHELLAMQ